MDHTEQTWREVLAVVSPLKLEESHSRRNWVRQTNTPSSFRTSKPYGRSKLRGGHSSQNWQSRYPTRLKLQLVNCGRWKWLVLVCFLPSKIYAGDVYVANSVTNGDPLWSISFSFKFFQLKDLFATTNGWMRWPRNPGLHQLENLIGFERYYSISSNWTITKVDRSKFWTNCIRFRIVDFIMITKRYDALIGIIGFLFFTLQKRVRLCM